ncbi:class I SAM-dependent methyltransferase [Frateuria sp. GZRe12]|uniref:class I SAM-dependent methyltransferase n=1 Tax=Frateuria sp. GZRe12 TaxID=3351533 RepID=UPI003EDC9F98
MARITTPPNEGEQPHIAREDVYGFFENRAARIDSLGPVRAVIYQDNHPDLAERRDRAEKERLLPMLMLEGAQRLLDIGCGTGRWAGDLIPSCRHYHGIDFSPGLVAHASQQFSEHGNARFSVASADDFSLARLGEVEPFDRILCCGVLIYLNDDEVMNAFRCMAASSAPETRILLREPMGTQGRLTLQKHHSDELQHDYNAIYRTRDELVRLLQASIPGAGFAIRAEGDLFLDVSLNNRADTRQRWMILERP